MHVLVLFGCRGWGLRAGPRLAAPRLTLAFGLLEVTVRVGSREAACLRVPSNRGTNRGGEDLRARGTFGRSVHVDVLGGRWSYLVSPQVTLPVTAWGEARLSTVRPCRIHFHWHVNAACRRRDFGGCGATS